LSAELSSVRSLTSASFFVPVKVSEVLSVEEAGRKLGLGRAAAYAHAKAGHIPTLKLGNRTLVPKAALARLLAST
jgi:excisionase family DNA binding protein